MQNNNPKIKMKISRNPAVNQQAKKTPVKVLCPYCNLPFKRLKRHRCHKDHSKTSSIIPNIEENHERDDVSEASDGNKTSEHKIDEPFFINEATIKVRELSSVVSNEMLHKSFSAFGKVRRALHLVDEEGRPTGEGIVKFKKTNAAQEALAHIEEKIFTIENSRPLRAYILQKKYEQNGLPEERLAKSDQQIMEFELGPHSDKSFEHFWGYRWKNFYQYEEVRRKNLETELKELRQLLEKNMMDEYNYEMLREKMEHHKEELKRLEAACHLRDQQRQQQMLDQMGRGAGGGYIPSSVNNSIRQQMQTFGTMVGGEPHVLFCKEQSIGVHGHSPSIEQSKNVTDMPKLFDPFNMPMGFPLGTGSHCDGEGLSIPIPIDTMQSSSSSSYEIMMDFTAQEKLSQSQQPKDEMDDEIVLLE